MTISAEATPKKRRTTSYTKHRTQIGIGLEMATRSIKRRDGTSTSVLEHNLALNFQGAMEGRVKSVKLMIRAIKANMKAADEQGFTFRSEREISLEDKLKKYIDEEPWHSQRKARPEPTNADLALFILGIAGVGDPRLESLGDPGTPKYREGLKTLSPSKFEPWFLHEMIVRAERMGLPDSDCKAIVARMDASSRNFSEWHANKDRLIADMIQIRGPAATRFAPGQSGNRRGRPRKTPIQLPYDGFLMQMVEYKILGKMRKVSRLDALIFKLSTMDPTRYPGVSAQVTELLMRLHERGWKLEIPLPTVIEI